MSTWIEKGISAEEAKAAADVLKEIKSALDVYYKRQLSFTEMLEIIQKFLNANDPKLVTFLSIATKGKLDLFMKAMNDSIDKWREYDSGDHRDQIMNFVKDNQDTWKEAMVTIGKGTLMENKTFSEFLKIVKDNVVPMITNGAVPGPSSESTGNAAADAAKALLLNQTADQQNLTSALTGAALAAVSRELERNEDLLKATRAGRIVIWGARILRWGSLPMMATLNLSARAIGALTPKVVHDAVGGVASKIKSAGAQAVQKPVERIAEITVAKVFRLYRLGNPV